MFKYLSAVITENYYLESNKNIKLFNGFRVFGVDGSKITLPYTEELKTVFEESKNNTSTVLVQARSSVLYDVLNHIALDSVLENLKLGERELALKHSSQWKKNDLIIYDRGYPSYDFKFEHIKAGIDYLIRVKTTHSKAVKSFVCSGKRTMLIDVFPQEKHFLKGKITIKTLVLKCA